jgi:anti-sigma-K factor RskA
MNAHQQREEDFDLYALGMLEPGDAAEMEAHAQSCVDCAEKMAEARGRIALLSVTAPLVTPGEDVKRRLMERVRSEARPAAAVVVAGAGSKRERPEREKSRWGWWVLAPLAVGLAAATVLLWMENSRMQRELAALQQENSARVAIAHEDRQLVALLTAPDTVRVPLAPAEGTTGTGEVRYNQRQGTLVYTGQLGALPPDKSYQLWLVPAEGSPISAGVFTPDASGNSTVLLPQLGTGISAKAFAVTVEPAGGVPAPTGPKVLIGAVT